MLFFYSDSKCYLIIDYEMVVLKPPSKLNKFSKKILMTNPFNQDEIYLNLVLEYIPETVYKENMIQLIILSI